MNLNNCSLSPAFYDDILEGISYDKIQPMKDVLSSFITNTIDFQQAKSQSINLIGTFIPVEKLINFMDVPDQPTSVTDNDDTFNPHKKSKSWSSYEDRRLIAAMHKYGPNDWTKICEFVGNGRNRNQCSQRWLRSLNPIINKSQWSSDEDIKLINAVNHYGDRSWTKVAAEIPGRTDVQCRYRFQIIGKKYPRALGIDQNQFFSQCYHLPTFETMATANASPTIKQEEVKKEPPVVAVKNQPTVELADMWSSLHLIDLIKEMETDPTSFFNN